MDWQMQSNPVMAVSIAQGDFLESPLALSSGNKARLGDMELLGVGRTAEVYAYGEGKVLKLYMGWMPHDAIEKEFANNRYVAALGVNAPEAFDLVEVEGRRGIVFRRLSGSSMLKVIAAKPWRIGAEAIRLARSHADLHAVAAADGMKSQVDEISHNIRATPFLSDDEKSRVLTYLASLPLGDKLCHGDYHPGNIIIDHQYWIIDWMVACSGNPACDVARTMLLLTLSAFPPDIPWSTRLLFTVARKVLASLYLRAYLRATGVRKSEVTRWYLPAAAARLVEGNPEDEKRRLLVFIDRELRKIKRRK
jgi:uncharacterized protein (TIGR02172 family)